MIRLARTTPTCRTSTQSIGDPKLTRVARGLAVIFFSAAGTLFHASNAAGNTILRVETTPLTKKTHIAPKQHLEACASAASGKQYRWRFEADGLVDFNVHFHATSTAVDGTRKEIVEYPVKVDGIRRHDGTLVTQNQHVHCWMWSNRSSRAVDVVFTIEPR